MNEKLKKVAAIVAFFGSLATIASYLSASDTYTSNGANSPVINNSGGSGVNLNYSTTSYTTTGDKSPIVSNQGSGNVNLDYSENNISIGDFNPDCPPIRVSQFEQLKIGMSYEDVIRIVGIKGNKSVKSGRATMYTWGKPTFACMTATFIDGSLTQVSQLGLKN